MLTRLQNWFKARSARRQNRQAQIIKAHDSVLNQALNPAFYGDDGARDDFFGRFGMVILHAALLMRRLRTCGEAGTDFAQSLFDTMFLSFDDALRETGVGDTGIGKRIKHLGQRFYGAATAYDAALAEPDPKPALIEALSRNTALPAKAVANIATYVHDTAKSLEQQEAQTLLQGVIDWPETAHALKQNLP